MQHLISVIVPAYNAEATIEKCLWSILQGEYSNIEIIVVNDGSLDETQKIVESILSQDQRILLYNQSNAGVGAARNSGLRLAKGDYIAWCDSDDWVEKDWLASLYKTSLEHDADIAICAADTDKEYNYPPDSVLLWNKEECIEQFFLQDMLNGCLVTKLFKKELFENESFDLSMRYWEDSDILWRLLKKVNKVAKTFVRSYHYCIHEGSLSTSSINGYRIHSTIALWKKITDDCIGTKYEDASWKKLVEWYCGDLRMIYKSGYLDRAIQRSMQQTVAVHIHRITNIRERAICFALSKTPNCVRMLYKIREMII